MTGREAAAAEVSAMQSSFGVKMFAVEGTPCARGGHTGVRVEHTDGVSSPSLHAPGPVSVEPMTDGDGPSTPRRPLARHERLAARVFALNAAVVILSCTVTV